MFRTQSSEMRNLSAFQRRVPRAARVFIIPSLSPSPIFAHPVSARGYGTCSAIAQSLSVGLSAFARGNDKQIPQTLMSMYGSMLVTTV